MKFASILRLAFHALWQNKLRTLLTVVVLTVVSFVVVFLFSFAYSFYDNVNKGVNAMLNQETTDLQFVAAYEYRSPNGYDTSMQGYLTNEQIQFVLDKYNDGTGNFSYVFFGDNQQGSIKISESVKDYNTYNNYNYISVRPFYAHSNPFINVEDYLESGRMWDGKTDEKSNNIFLTSDCMQYYNIGDTIELTMHKYNPSYSPSNNSSSNNSHYSEVKDNFTVRGFLNLTDFKIGYNSGISNSAFIDYSHFNDPLPTENDYKSMTSSDRYYGWGARYAITSISLSVAPQEDYEYGTGIQNYLQKTQKDYAKVTNGYLTPEVESQLLEMLKMIFILQLVFYGLALFVSIIIVLLSIGCVANTIKISAEQNRRFFGVMKAIGMKNGSLRMILMLQVILITFVAVLIASAVVFPTIGILTSILEMLINSMFYSVAGSFVIKATMSPIIPFAVAAVLILFVLLFTRTSLSEISKMDVISVINEVN